MSLSERLFLARTGEAALRDIDAIDLFRTEFSSEFDLLQTTKLSHTARDEREGIRWDDKSCSQVLYGQSVSVIDRLSSHLLAVKWLCEGSGDKFKRYCCDVSRSDFIILQEHSRTALRNSSDIQVLLVLIVSVFLAKYAPQFYASAGVQQGDTGQLPATMAYEALQKGRLRCAQHLEKNQKEALLECLHIASRCDLASLAVAELVPGNLAAFDSMDHEATSQALELCFILSVIQSECDFFRAALVADQLVNVRQQLLDLIARRCTSLGAYYNVAQHRLKTLEPRGFRHLSPEVAEERALLRMIAMGQCVSRSRAEWICRAFYGLSEIDRASLVHGLSLDGRNGQAAVIPLGMHTLFEHGLKQTNGSVASLVEALSSLMRFLVRVLDIPKSMPGSHAAFVVLCAELALSTVQSEDFKKNPNVLDALQIPPPRIAHAASSAAHETHPSTASAVADSPNMKVDTTSRDSAADRSTAETNTDITVKTCRACSGKFTYKLPTGDVTIICGVPDMSRYKAVSYVWGEVRQLNLRCATCSATHTTPMESKTKFERIMQMVGPSSNIWLDAVSIDQNNQQDIATQIALMGDIYSNAQRVGVLLPASDKQAFQIINEAAQCADHISQRTSLFTQGNEGEAEVALGKVCQQFFGHLVSLDREQIGCRYWQRAWTFQEMALAKDIDIWCEDSSIETQLTSVKYRILTTTLFLVRYILDAHQYASVKVGFTRGYALEYLTLAKRLFPHEGLFLSNEQIDPKEYAFQALFPHLNMDQLLGIRQHQQINFRSRLSLMLDAFDSNQRKARFEADLVCCWASMCNIKFDYDKNDSRAVALHKVLAAIRRDGSKVFNFHVNTEARLETDLHFINYAKVHRLCNLTNKAFLLKAPVFSGQTDTAFHIRHSLMQPDELPQLPHGIVEMRTIRRGGHAVKFVELTDREAVELAFAQSVQGARTDGIGWIYTDIIDKVTEALEAVPHSQLEKYVMVVAQIPVTLLGSPASGGLQLERRLPAWAICPRSRVCHSTCEVAREGLNGTLVLAADSKEGLQAVAYLTLTHGQSGTYLLAVDDTTGEISIEFAPPQRSDILHNMPGGGLVNDSMRVRVEFEQAS